VLAAVVGASQGAAVFASVIGRAHTSSFDTGAMISTVAPVGANLDTAVLALKSWSTFATCLSAVTLILRIITIRWAEKVEISAAICPREARETKARALHKIADSALIAIVEADLPFAGLAGKAVLT